MKVSRAREIRGFLGEIYTTRTVRGIKAVVNDRQGLGGTRLYPVYEGNPGYFIRCALNYSIRMVLYPHSLGVKKEKSKTKNSEWMET